MICYRSTSKEIKRTNEGQVGTVHMMLALHCLKLAYVVIKIRIFTAFL